MHTTKYKQKVLALSIAIILLLSSTRFVTVSKAGIQIAPQYYTMTYTASNDTTKYNYVKVSLGDSGTGIVPQGSENRLPVNNSTWEPMWSPAGDSIQNLLSMYNGSGISNRAVLINTDYFCRESTSTPQDDCSGHAGSPQGLFIKNGTVYHKAPTTTVRAALKFAPSRQASIGAMGWNSGTSGIQNAVSGGPIVLQNGTKVCNPEGSDLSGRCGTTLTERSAACISSDGYTLWLITTANGYTTNWSNLATFMQSQLGCYNGMQFDGGSSVNLVVGGSHVSSNANVGSGLLISYSGPCNPCLTDEPIVMPDINDDINAQ